jgi:riboflavin synthase
MQLGDRLGGHLVLGHVDGVGHVQSVEEQETSWLFRISIPAQFERYVISVGSIAVDGVSLTVAAIEGTVVTVSIIPHTMENTIFSTYRPSAAVNLEFDMIGKYVERLLGGLASQSRQKSITVEQLRNWGYSF